MPCLPHLGLRRRAATTAEGQVTYSYLPTTVRRVPLFDHPGNNRIRKQSIKFPCALPRLSLDDNIAPYVFAAHRMSIGCLDWCATSVVPPHRPPTIAKAHNVRLPSNVQASYVLARSLADSRWRRCSQDLNMRIIQLAAYHTLDSGNSTTEMCEWRTWTKANHRQASRGCQHGLS